MTRSPLLRVTAAGLYCEVGGFHIDPWGPVAKAIVTHAHADHFVTGCRQYVTTRPGRRILQHRLGPRADIQPLDYGAELDCFGVKVSLHPAGHILGSAQVRVEYRGEVWVVSGDYKVAQDATCAAFEPLRCHTFVTESTFGQPCFAWEPQQTTFTAMHDWWRANQLAGQASVVYSYAVGKAQRVLAGLNAELGPIIVHPQIAAFNELYRDAGVNFPAAHVLTEANSAVDWSSSLILLPPQERWRTTTPWTAYRTAFVSGWMALPDGPQQRRVQSGFALSDHADHRELLETVRATGAEHVLVTHGSIDELVGDLRQAGFDAHPLRTPRCKPVAKVSLE